MDDRTLLHTGIVGGVVAAVCCVTPVLVIALSALGLSAWLAWADYVLLPMLAFCLALAAFAFWRLRRNLSTPPATHAAVPGTPFLPNKDCS